MKKTYNSWKSVNQSLKVSQSGAIDLSISIMTWFTAQGRHPYPNPINNEVFVRSMKRYSGVAFLKLFREIVFPNCLDYSCINDAYSDFPHRFEGPINFTAPAKWIRVKANSKPWFDNHITSIIQRWDKLYNKFRHYGLETNKDNFKVTKMHLQKMTLKKRKPYFKEELAKNRSKPKELWKI